MKQLKDEIINENNHINCITQLQNEIETKNKRNGEIRKTFTKEIYQHKILQSARVQQLEEELTSRTTTKTKISH